MTTHYLGLAEDIRQVADHFLMLLYPMHFGGQQDLSTDAELRAKVQLETTIVSEALKSAISRFKTEEEASALTADLLAALPEIKALIDTDVQAAYEGDPAAVSPDEVILCYPAFRAISIYRIAHRLYKAGVPVVPRMMTELEHSRTGIDIHPGAEIGPYFFIDHGTGVVIGETAVLGERVKLYQHVTLGAKSFAVEEDGTLVKGIKRHPQIGNGVVIYSGATILGGDTHIGDGCVIGGSVWLTHSVPAGTTVTNHRPA